MDFISIGIALAFILLGYIVGGTIEKRHYRSIIEREKQLQSVITLATKHPPENAQYKTMVTTSLVLSSDPFKRFIAGFINFFGGRITAYETLLDRGRREAILRLKQQAIAAGANMIVNVKFETSRLSQSRKVAIVEIMAYGTAVKYE